MLILLRVKGILTMAISDWPVNERPREKLLAQGAQSLSDAELLAIFLRVGVRGKSAVDLARDLLSEFGCLRKLLETSQTRFCQYHGLGLAKYVQLQAILEMSQRHLFATMPRGQALQNSATTKLFLTSKLRGYEHEVFACLFLDTRHQIINYEELTHGTINNAQIHPRQVVKRALSQNAAAMILAHNHPSGNAEPSLADKNLTKQLKAVLDLIDVKILDHIIVGDGQCVSFAERGLL